MRLKELRGLPVIDPTAARKVGTVTDYQVDPVAGRVAALDIGGTESGEPQRILGDRIRRVGRHAVILTGRANASPSVVPELNDHWLDAGSLVGLEVMGDDGNSIGALMDGAFNQDSLEIEAYLLQRHAVGTADRSTRPHRAQAGALVQSRADARSRAAASRRSSNPPRRPTSSKRRRCR